MEHFSSRLLSTWGIKETEANWEKVETLFKELSCNVTQYNPNELLHCLQQCMNVLQGALSTERTRLFLAVLEAVNKSCTHLQGLLEPIQDQIAESLFKQCERSSRLLAERAKATLILLYRASPSPIKPALLRMQEILSKSLNKNLRLAVAESLGVLLDAIPALSRTGSDSHFLNSNDGETLLKRLVKETLEDASEPVRITARLYFSKYETLYPSCATNLISTLPAAIQRALLKGRINENATVINPSKFERSNFKTFLASTSDSSALKSESTPTLSRSITKPIAPGSVKSGPLRVIPPKIISETTESKMTLSENLPAITVSGKNRKSMSDLKAANPTNNSTSRLKSKSQSSMLKPPIDYKPTSQLLIKDFIALVKSNDWDVRCKALVSFSQSLSTDTDRFLITILASPPILKRLFDILIFGLMDVHFRVISAVINYGIILLGTLKSENFTNNNAGTLLNYVQTLVLRLISIRSNSQFSIRPKLVSDANYLVSRAIIWSNIFPFEVLSSSLLRQDLPIYLKVRPILLEHMINVLATIDLADIEPSIVSQCVRRVAVFVSDQSLSKSAGSVLRLVQQKMNWSEDVLMQHVPSSGRAFLKEYTSSLGEVNPFTLSTPVSPKTSSCLIETNELVTNDTTKQISKPNFDSKLEKSETTKEETLQHLVCNTPPKNESSVCISTAITTPLNMMRLDEEVMIQRSLLNQTLKRPLPVTPPINCRPRSVDISRSLLDSDCKININTSLSNPNFMHKSSDSDCGFLCSLETDTALTHQRTHPILKDNKSSSSDVVDVANVPMNHCENNQTHPNVFEREHMMIDSCVHSVTSQTDSANGTMVVSSTVGPVMKLPMDIISHVAKRIYSRLGSSVSTESVDIDDQESTTLRTFDQWKTNEIKSPVKDISKVFSNTMTDSLSRELVVISLKGATENQEIDNPEDKIKNLPQPPLFEDDKRPRQGGSGTI